MAYNFFARLKFLAPNVKSKLSEVKKEFTGLKNSVNGVAQGIRQSTELAQGAALAAAPLGLGAAKIIQESAEFEKGLSAVQSVLLTTKDNMSGVRAEAKALGISTKFTAFEATEGAKKLAQAGFNTSETIAAMSGMLDLAASAEVGVADAANIMASNIRAFGMSADDASQVADILALTTSRTNTDLIELGEGLKMVAATAKNAGFDLGDTATALGVLANAGVKGTLGATALRAGLNKLAKPSKKAIALFGDKAGFASAVQQADGKLRPFEEIMANLATRISTLRGDDKLAAIGDAAELLGIRGTTAFGAFKNQMMEQTEVTESNIEMFRQGFAASGESLDKFKLKVGDTIPKLVALKFEIKAASGTAREMARIRLDNLAGDFTILQSAANGLAIELGGIPSGPLRGLTQGLTEFLQTSVKGFQLASGDVSSFKNELNDAFKNGPLIDQNADMDFAQATSAGGAWGARFVDGVKGEVQKGDNVFANFNNSLTQNEKDARDFASGFKDGFSEAVTQVKELGTTIMEFFKGVTNNENLTVKDLGRLVGKFLTLGIIAAPILLGISASLFVIGPIVTGLIGVFKTLFFTMRLGTGLLDLILLGPLKLLGGGNAFKGLKSGFIGIWGVVKKFGKFILRAATGFGMFKTIGAIALKAIGGLFTFLISPIGLVIAAIIGIGVVLYVFRDEVKAAVISAVNWFGNFSVKVVNWVVSAFDTIGDWISNTWDWVLNKSSEFGASLKSGFNIIKNFAVGIFNSIGDTISNTWTWLSDGFYSAMDFIQISLKKGWDFITKSFNDGVDVVFGIFDSLSLKVDEIWGGIKTTFLNFVDFIKQAFNIFSTTSGEEGIFSGITGTAEFVVNAVKDKFDFLAEKIRNIFSNIFISLKSSAKAIGGSISSTFSGLIDKINPFSSEPSNVQPPRSGINPSSTRNTEPAKSVTDAANVTLSAIKANRAANRSQAIINSAPNSISSGRGDLTASVSDRPIQVNSNIILDGKIVARSISRSSIENAERRGKNISPIERRRLVENGPIVS